MQDAEKMNPHLAVKSCKNHTAKDMDMRASLIGPIDAINLPQNRLRRKSGYTMKDNERVVNEPLPKYASDSICATCSSFKYLRNREFLCYDTGLWCREGRKDFNSFYESGIRLTTSHVKEN